MAKKAVCHQLLSAVLATLVLVVEMLGCSRPTGDELASRHLRRIAGDRATDCGHVGLHQSPATVNDCTLAAWKANRSFVVRYDVQGIDSELVVGLASNGNGEISSVKYDSMGWSTDGLRGEKVTEDNHILLTPCPRPTKLFASKSGYLSCY